MNSPFQGAEIPGMGSMNDPLGFVKKLWGDMHLPGMVTPTVSIDELDKKIKDLQTVEAWLSVNMNMLRGTIQALEVQRATIANLKTMGENFAQQMNSASAKAGFGATAEAPKSNAGWPMSEQKAPAEPPKAAEKAEPAPAPPKPAAEAPPTKAAEDKSEAAAPFANPAAWWNLLQDQFKQAVSKAMEHEMPEPDGKAAGSKSKSAANANGATAKAAPKGSTAAAPKTRAKAPAAKTPAKKVAATTSAKKRATPRAASK
jgi:type IV secretory pathway VirB10-like protein